MAPAYFPKNEKADSRTLILSIIIINKIKNARAKKWIKSHIQILALQTISMQEVNINPMTIVNMSVFTKSFFLRAK